MFGFCITINYYMIQSNVSVILNIDHARAFTISININIRSGDLMTIANNSDIFCNFQQTFSIPFSSTIKNNIVDQRYSITSFCCSHSIGQSRISQTINLSFSIRSNGYITIGI